MPATVASWTQLPGYVGTVTVQTCYSGQGTFTNFTITGDCVISNGVWTHTTNATSAINRLGVTVGGAFLLASNAQISVDSRGFQQGSGPGGVGTGDSRGPSHGGQGAYTQASAPEPTYGSAFQPTTLGSGGGSGGGGGPGGGAVQLTVAGAAQIDGSILAKGGYRTDGLTRPATGGSIFITAGTLSGGGLLDARALDIGSWVGGGGGRIAVILTNGTTFGSLTMRAYGGTGAADGVRLYHGAAGTIYRQTMGQTIGQGTLTIDNNGYALSALYAVTEPSEAMNLNSLQTLIITNGGMFSVVTNTTLDFATTSIQGGGELKIRATNLVSFPAPFIVTNTYRLCLDTNVSAVGNWTIMTNAVVTHSPNFYLGPNPERRINLTLGGNLTIAAGGAIDVTDRGYAGNTGPGPGTGDNFNASHGGRGASGIPAATYGSVLQPMTQGSGNTTGSKFPGAGAVVLSVTGSTTIDGAIRAYSVSSWPRCAAGGSVFITTGTMGGGGTIDASAGASGVAGAGGGRVAVILTNGASFGSVVFKAYGGDGGGTTQEGAAGTIYKQTTNDVANGGIVVIDNVNLATNGIIFTPLPAFQTSIEDLRKTQWTAQNKGKIGLVTNVSIAGLTLNASSYLDLAGYTGTVSALTITNKSFGAGTYAASSLGGLVSDSSGGSGRIVVIPPALYVDDTNVMEGASGTTTNASFGVRIVNAVVPVTFSYYTTNGTATNGVDFVGTNGTVTIPAGVTQTNILVAVIGHDWIQPAKTFRLEVTNVTGTAVANSEGVCTISNTNARTIAIGPTTVNQPASGTTNAIFTVTLSQVIGTDVSFLYDTQDGSATVADGDYNPVSGVAGTITAGQTTTNIAIVINGDNAAESVESFNVVLRNPSPNATLGGASTGVCSVINNNGPPVLFVTNLVTVTEGNSGTTNAVLAVWSSKSPTNRVTFQYGTLDGTATTNDHDYVGTIAGVGALEIGQTQTNIVIPVNGDLKVEPTERFYVVMSNPSNAVIVTAATGACDIVNDDYPFVWSGAGTNSLASNTNNWRWNGVQATRLPASTDDVLLDSTSNSSNLIWNAASNGLSATVANWRQTVDYTGTVTVQTVYGPAWFTNLTISGDCVISNGVWTHLANPVGNTATYRLAVTVGGAFTLASAAQIGIDSLGFQQGSGPGGVGAGDARGASHGGQGGYQQSGLPEPTYGSAFQPTTLGSGGSSGGGGGTGGGAVQLTVGGTAQIEGPIQARGGTSNTKPASGGSIFITAGSMIGGGLLDVRAVDLGASSWSAGGGGRIAVILTNGTTFGSITLRANGGASGTYGGRSNHGAAGTIYRQIMGQTSGQGTLIIDNNGYPFAMHAVTEPCEALNVNALQALVITNGAMFSVVTNTTLDFAVANIQGGGELKIRSTNGVSFPAPFIVTNAYRLCLDTNVSAVGNWTIMTNAVVTHSPNFYLGPNSERSINLTLAGDLTIAAGGAIDVSDRGYAGGTGPGAGTWDTLDASHGGQGASGGATPAATYGAVLRPMTQGSGNSTGGGVNPGGGVVMLSVSGTTTIDGAIRANATYGGRRSAGGSVFITTGSLGGNGTVDASAGNSDVAGAGGGRIAVILTNGTSFGSVVLKAYGGDGGGTTQEGAAGTVYRQTMNDATNAGIVLVDNNSLATNVVVTPVPAFVGSTENLAKTQWTAQNKGKIGLVTNVTIASVTLNGNAYLELGGYTGSVSFLTITNHAFRDGTYAASDLGGLVTDSSGGNGRIIVNSPLRGTVFKFR